jgi:hypothetical protein
MLPYGEALRRGDFVIDKAVAIVDTDQFGSISNNSLRMDLGKGQDNV